MRLFEKDENGRYIDVNRIDDAVVISKSSFYPNIIFDCKVDGQDKIITPSSERVMSLQLSGVRKNTVGVPFASSFEKNPVFFFVYNTDNYFHFIYDTLPYLISYNALKDIFPGLKLLMNYPHECKKEHYKFVTEFLDIIGIKEKDILIIDKYTCYSSIYISTSYTHDFDSNLPPRKEVYSFLQKVANHV